MFTENSIRFAVLNHISKIEAHVPKGINSIQNFIQYCTQQIDHHSYRFRTANLIPIHNISYG